MPRRWERDWHLTTIDDVEERQLRTSECNARLHRLGNLTLTTLKLNEKMSNGAWSTKQKQLNLGSKLVLNTELIEQHPAVFDEEAIDGRTADLAARVCRIWPRPAVG